MDQPNPPPLSQDFMNSIREWKHIDDALRNERNTMKEWRKKQNALGSSILQYMENNQLTGFRFELKDGQIKYAMSRRQSSVNKKHIFNRLMLWFEGDEEKASKLTEFILDGREVSEKPRLSRRVIRIPDED